MSAITAVSGPKIERGTGYIKVCCPVPSHDDRTPSVSIRYDPVKGKTSVNCFGGCDDRDVLAAANLSVRDLFDEDREFPAERRSSSGTAARGGNAARPAAPRRAPSAGSAKASASKRKGPQDREVASRKSTTYVYQRADGTPRGKVVRREEFDAAGERIAKKFSQQRFDDAKRRWVSGGFEPLVYRAPEVAAALAAGTPVYLFEGEKDADTARDLELVGTTNAQGAKKFLFEHAEQLRGAHVVQVVDRDVAGYGHAIHVRSLLHPDDGEALAASYTVLAPAEGKDFTEHVAAGKGVDELVEVDPVAAFVDLQLAAAGTLVDGGDVTRARRLLEIVAAHLDQVTDDEVRQGFVAVAENLTTRLTPPPDDELANQRRKHTRNSVPFIGDDVEGEEVDPPEPAWTIPTGSGSWAYSTGDDGDGLRRGVYRYNRGVWQMVAPLP
ncbi:hypothetical protein ACFWX0_60040, partial [Nonomuraea sp. NPDC059022]